MSLTKNLEYTPRFDNKRIMDSKLNKSKTKYLIPTFFRDIIIPLSENDDYDERENDHLVSENDQRATIVKRVQSERIESMGNNEDDEY